MRKILITISVVLVAGLMLFGGWHIGYSMAKEKDGIYKNLDIFAEALSTIQKQYVEDKSSHDLIYGAMDGMMLSLDKFSQFLNPEEYKDLLTETGGTFGGIGIEIVLRDGLLTVVSPLEDTPAWKAGVKPEDIIVKINDVSTKGMTLEDAVKKLRGEPGSKVKLTLLRSSDKSLQEVNLERAMILLKDIKRAMILENGIGYVRIVEFRDNTSKELGKQLAELKKQGLKGLIIDVRNNPGGLLFSAIEISSRFLEDDKLIVSTRSRNEKEVFYKSMPLSEKYLDIPITVLMNRGSASGSEILAAALRDNNRAVLIGDTTFGKGSVQTVIPLSDGSALRLTTSKYYTPKGISIHEKGIIPDIKTADDKESTEGSEAEEIFAKVEKKDKKDSKDADQFDWKKDKDITRALDLIKGLMVLSTKK